MIKVSNLCVKYGSVTAVDNVSFEINDGEIIGIVGESGSGKSVTALTVMGLTKGNPQISGDICLDDVCLTKLSDKEYAALRGNDISMVFQEPMTSLNPLMKTGPQIKEMLDIHQKLPKEEAYKRVIDALDAVAIHEPENVYGKYPHELSGGMRQRAMIAMATMLSPKLLIADEPTTALDANTQGEIVELIKAINEKNNTSVLFITHNLKLANAICNRIIVMQKGRVVECGTSKEIFENPKEEYTKKLIDAIPKRVKLKQVMADE